MVPTKLLDFSILVSSQLLGPFKISPQLSLTALGRLLFIVVWGWVSDTWRSLIGDTCHSLIGGTCHNLIGPLMSLLTRVGLHMSLLTHAGLFVSLLTRADV